MTGAARVDEPHRTVAHRDVPDTAFSIVSRLNVRMLRHLRLSLGSSAVVMPVEGWSGLLAAVRDAQADLAVVDPSITDTTDGVRAVMALHRELPETAIVLYMPLSAPGMHAALELSEVGIRQCVLERFDDSPDRLRHMVETARLPGLAEALLEQLMPHLYHPLAPFGLPDAMRQLFRRPMSLPGRDAFARTVGVSVRHLNRSLARVGIAPAVQVMTGARLLRAYQLLRHPRRTIAEAARFVGYASPRQFSRLAKEFTSVAPAQWHDVDPVDYVGMVLDKIRNGPAGTTTVQDGSRLSARVSAGSGAENRAPFPPTAL